MICEKAKDLKQIVEELKHLDDRIWDIFTLRKDPRFKKITLHERDRILECSPKYAYVQYSKLVGKFGQLTISEYVLRKSITVIEDDSEVDPIVPYFALYNSEPPVIKIACQSINCINKVLSNWEIAGELKSVNLKDVILAHELFHNLEEVSSDNKSHSTRLSKLKHYFFDSYAVGSSEIAAMHFSRILNGIDFSPGIYEILLLHEINKPAFEESIKFLLHD
ncbi:MAG: hypothetical protein ACYCVD_11755 [Desulfitobacteriaceae bacterium]